VHSSDHAHADRARRLLDDDESGALRCKRQDFTVRVSISAEPEQTVVEKERVYLKCLHDKESTHSTHRRWPVQCMSG
jgi:hypothetical protein